MRTALIASFALGLLGCIAERDHDGEPDYWGGGGGGWGSGWGGGDGAPELGCQADSECGGLTCTRTGECLEASQVRAVSTVWTVDEAIASETSCSATPHLSITFGSSGGEQFGYTPVPCKAGKFTIDKFPTRFMTVQLARDGDYGGGAFGTFDSQGTAMLDLPY